MMIKTPIQRLEEKVYKENLWIFLFKLLEERDEYAYELRKKTRENTNLTLLKKLRQSPPLLMKKK